MPIFIQLLICFAEPDRSNSELKTADCSIAVDSDIVAASSLASKEECDGTSNEL